MWYTTCYLEEFLSATWTLILIFFDDFTCTGGALFISAMLKSLSKDADRQHKSRLSTELVNCSKWVTRLEKRFWWIIEAYISLMVDWLKLNILFVSFSLCSQLFSRAWMRYQHKTQLANEINLYSYYLFCIHVSYVLKKYQWAIFYTNCQTKQKLSSICVFVKWLRPQALLFLMQCKYFRTL